MVVVASWGCVYKACDLEQSKASCLGCEGRKGGRKLILQLQCRLYNLL